MELTSEDRQRIEQEAKNYGKLFRQAFIEGAEYATIFERQKEGERCPSLPECYAASKKLEALEAERSELRNKVIDEAINKIRQLTPPFQYDPSDSTLLTQHDAIEILNSLKTNQI